MKTKKIQIALISLMLLLAMSLAQTPASQYFASIISEANIVALTNESRTEKKLKPLKISKELEAAATKKAKDILEKQYFAHYSPENKSPWDFIDESGYFFRFAGENLAIHFQEAEDVTQGWLTSADHRKNIMNRKYRDIGIGIAKGKFLNTETTVVVQMFGKSMPKSWIVKHGSIAKNILKNEKKRRILLAKAGISPSVQGISAEKIIQNAEYYNVVWNPEAKLFELYALSKKYTESHVLFLPLLILCFLACATMLIWYRPFDFTQGRLKKT